jgi:hypothetical protein
MGKLIEGSWTQVNFEVHGQGYPEGSSNTLATHGIATAMPILTKWTKICIYMIYMSLFENKEAVHGTVAAAPLHRIGLSRTKVSPGFFRRRQIIGHGFKRVVTGVDVGYSTPGFR